MAMAAFSEWPTNNMALERSKGIWEMYAKTQAENGRMPPLRVGGKVSLPPLFVSQRGIRAYQLLVLASRTRLYRLRQNQSVLISR